MGRGCDVVAHLSRLIPPLLQEKEITGEKKEEPRLYPCYPLTSCSDKLSLQEGCLHGGVLLWGCVARYVYLVHCILVVMGNPVGNKQLLKWSPSRGPHSYVAVGVEADCMAPTQRVNCPVNQLYAVQESGPDPTNYPVHIMNIHKSTYNLYRIEDFEWKKMGQIPCFKKSYA